jgi:hypothetical protein
MRLLRICPKCKSRYLLFHLTSDCDYISRHFELIRSAAKKDIIDYQLAKKKQGNLIIVCANIVKENLDEKSSVMEWGRFSSFPFLFFLIGFLLGILSLFIKDAFGILSLLGIIGVVGYFLWAIFLLQGGFNYIFKILIVHDLLRRYNIKLT